MECNDKNWMVRTGLEPGMRSTAKAWKRSSNELSHELAQETLQLFAITASLQVLGELWQQNNIPLTVTLAWLHFVLFFSGTSGRNIKHSGGSYNYTEKRTWLGMFSTNKTERIKWAMRLKESNFNMTKHTKHR